MPRQLLSDQGKQFKCALFKQLCSKLKIHKLQSSPYHPQSNGTVERLHGTVERLHGTVERLHGTLTPMLRKALGKGIDWGSQIKYCLYAIRNAPNWSTGFTPFEIVLGKNARFPLDLLVEELESPGGKSIAVCQWIENLNKHLSVIRNYVTESGLHARDQRKSQHNKGTLKREF